jgi:hypothetical protein
MGWLAAQLHLDKKRESMIRKSVQRFSEKIMLNQRPKARW